MTVLAGKLDGENHISDFPMGTDTKVTYAL